MKLLCPKTRRYKNNNEVGTDRKHVRRRYGAKGHLLKTCKELEKDSDAIEMRLLFQKCDSSFVAQPLHIILNFHVDQSQTKLQQPPLPLHA
jgi:hypothetical protein